MTVGRERWLRMSRALAAGHPAAGGLCSACVAALAVAGAGVTVMAGAGAQVSMCASDATVKALAELEFTLGNGPTVDAYERGTPVVEIDLVKVPPLRWSASPVRLSTPVWGPCSPSRCASVRPASVR